MIAQPSSWMVCILLAAWIHTDAFRPTARHRHHHQISRQRLHATTDAVVPSTYIPVQIAVPKLKKCVAVAVARRFVFSTTFNTKN